jgi:hypothetical protein
MKYPEVMAGLFSHAARIEVAGVADSEERRRSEVQNGSIALTRRTGATDRFGAFPEGAADRSNFG